MLVESISREQFDQWLPSHLPPVSLMVVDVEGFAKKAENLIGTIAEGKREAGSKDVILRRNKTGSLRVGDDRDIFYSRMGIERNGL